MKQILIILCLSVFSIASYAQQRITVANNGESNSDGNYSTKEIDGGYRVESKVVIQSSTKLSYTVMGVKLPSDKLHIELNSMIDTDGIFVDTICFYVDDNNSAYNLKLYAEGYPSETIDLNMLPKTTYNFMVIEPEGGVIYEDKQEDSYDGLLNQALIVMKTKDYEYAEKLLKRASEIKETDVVLANLAYTQYLQGTIHKQYYFNRAIQTGKKALALNSISYLANLSIGLSYAKKATYMDGFGGKAQTDYCVECVNHLFPVIQEKPDEFTEYHLLGDTYDKLFTAQWTNELRVATPNSDKWSYLYSLSSANDLIFRYENITLSRTMYKYAYNMMMCYKRCLKTEPSPEVYYKLGEAYVLLDKFDEAIDCFTKSITADNNKGEYKIKYIKERHYNGKPIN